VGSGEPPRFEQDRPAEIRFVAPSLSQPAGGAGVTLWLRVTNPNPFGFTLSTLDSTLFLEGQRAATGRFPLGRPPRAAGVRTDAARHRRGAGAMSTRRTCRRRAFGALASRLYDSTSERRLNEAAGAAVKLSYWFAP